MRNPITPSSLNSRKRRLSQLRKLFFRLRSMKRGAFARRIYSKQIGNLPAVLLLIDESISFVRCAFTQVSDPIIANAYNRLISALVLTRNDILLAFNRRSLRTNVVRTLGAATSNLYQSARSYSSIYNCDELWQKLGLLSIILLG